MATLTDAQARDWYAPMLDLARHLTRGDEELARDVVQDAFEKALRWPPASPTKGWLCHFVKHAHITTCRHRARHPGGTPLPLVDWTPRHAEGPERAVCDRETLAEIMALPGADLLRADAEGWPQADIAARYGITHQSVRTHIYRLRHGPLARMSPW
jgi:DNA-directed RNA polymerase specialized sigma24 family protein